MNTPPRIIMVGAHPDDCDFYAGGLAALWTQAGLTVEFVSATNGDAGHHEMGGGALARRRAAESAAAGAVLGIRYTNLDNHDGELTASLEHRRQIIRLLRTFQPDLVLTHRGGDYHADHRAASQLVQDATLLLTVPNLCPDTPALRAMPTVMHTEDGFSKPEPFVPDVVVDIDPVLDLKAQMAAAHESQVFEWLPWLDGQTAPTGPAERKAFVRAWMERRGRATADRFREQLCASYGPDHGNRVQCAEALALTEYGAPLTPERRAALFPFLP